MTNLHMKDILQGIVLIPVMTGMEIYRRVKRKRLNVEVMMEELVDKYDVRDVIDIIKYDDILTIGTELVGAYMVPAEPNQKGDLHIRTIKFNTNTLQSDIEILLVALHEIRHAMQYKHGNFDVDRYNKDVERIGYTCATYVEIPEEKDAWEFANKEVYKNLKYLVK